MISIEEKIYNRLKTIKNDQFPHIDELEFLNNTIKEYNENDKVEISHLLISYYMSVNENDNFSTIKNEIESLEDQLENIIHDIIKKIKVDNLSINYDLIDVPIFKEERYKKVLSNVVKFVLFSLTKVDESLIYLVGLNYISKLLIQQVKKELNVDETLSSIQRRKDKLLREYNKFVNRQIQEIDALEHIMKNISRQNKHNAVLTIEKNFIDMIDDDELKYELYKMITSLNHYYFIDILKENQRLKLNSTNYMRYLFNKMGQNIDYISDENISIISKYGSLSDIIDILNILKENDCHFLDLNSKEGIISLISTNSNIIYSIIDFLKHGIINNEFVIKNPSILYEKTKVSKENGLYNILTQNYNLLIKSGFNLTDSYLNEALLVDNAKMTYLIKLFSLYGLNKNYISKYMMLDDNFFNYVDSCIELGLDDFIQNTSIIDNNFLDVIKRIYISKMMHIQIFDYNGMLLPNIRNGNGFYINSSCFDNFIISETNNFIENDIYELLNNNRSLDISTDLIKEFDTTFKESDDIYNIDDIIISRKKALRNFNYLYKLFPNESLNNLLFVSCIHNSILDIEQINTIKEKIYNVKTKRL